MGARIWSRSPGLSLAAQPALLAKRVRKIFSPKLMPTPPSGAPPAGRRRLSSNPSYSDLPPASSLAQLSFSVAVRLNTGAPGFESIGSAKK